MKLFIFSPYTYVAKSPHCLIAYNTISNDYVIENSKLDFQLLNENRFIRVQSKRAETFCIQCEIKRMGFFQDVESFPFYPTYSLNILSSLERTSKLLNFNEGLNTKNRIKHITLMGVNHSFENFPDVVLEQIGYPSPKNEFYINEQLLSSVLECKTELFTLSSDLNELVIKGLIYKIPINYSFVIRTATDSVVILEDLLDKFENVVIELLFNKVCDFEKLSTIFEKYPGRLFAMPIISSKTEFYNFSKCKFDFIYKPIIFNPKLQSTFVKELLVNYKDVLHSQNLDKILLKSIYNDSLNGSIIVMLNGEIRCANQKIGKSDGADFFEVITQWLYQNDNFWKYSRNKYNQCRQCVLNNLCPSLTIFELQGLLQMICDKETFQMFNMKE